MGLKSIFDGLYIDQLIQKNEQGEFILYPHGLMGRGYLLPADREPAIRQRLRLTMLLSLIVGTMYGLFALRVVESGHVDSLLGWLLVIAIAVLLVGGILFYQSRLADGLEPEPGKQPTTGEWLRRGRKARPTWAARSDAAPRRRSRSRSFASALGVIARRRSRSRRRAARISARRASSSAFVLVSSRSAAASARSRSACADARTRSISCSSSATRASAARRTSSAAERASAACSRSTAARSSALSASASSSAIRKRSGAT